MFRRSIFPTLVASVLVAPTLIGCGSSTPQGASLPPVDDTRQMGGYGNSPTSMPPQQQRRGMSTTQKVAILAGAAALYYMYNKNKQRRAQGDTSQPQYYLSKNGRIYYRDNTGRAHWVTPPQEGIQVPWEEARQYQRFQGFNGQNGGMTLQELYQQQGMSNNNGGY